MQRQLISPTTIDRFLLNLFRFNSSAKFCSLSTPMTSSIVLPSISLAKPGFGASEPFRSSSCFGFRNEVRMFSRWNLEKSRVFMSVAVGSQAVVVDDALFKDYKPSSAFLFPGQVRFWFCFLCIISCYFCADIALLLWWFMRWLLIQFLLHCCSLSYREEYFFTLFHMFFLTEDMS